MKMFVYGSLMSGLEASDYLKGAQLVCADSLTVDRMSMYVHEGYPFVFSGRSKCQIKGELYEVPESLLKKLSEYEGDFYYITVTDVFCGKKIHCAYIFMGRGHFQGMEEVPEGDYRKYHDAKAEQ